MKTEFISKRSVLLESITFWGLVIIGLLPLIFTKYYLTLDGPGHIYNGNIIKELILGNHSEFINLFKFNTLPVPNWISHFMFAFLNMIFPDYISEKIVIGSFLILFPFLFRKIILWFAPENKVFSYLGILFAHNHLLYLGSYNMVYALVGLFAITYFILRHVTKLNLWQLSVLALLFLLIYFSHVLILMITILVALLLPLAALTVEQNDKGWVVSNWNLFYTKMKVTVLAMIPTVILTGFYLFNVDSLEEAPRMGLTQLLKWIVDIRPLLTLCYCEHWMHYTHLLFALFVVMMVTNLFLTIRNSCTSSEGRLKINMPKPRYSIIWFLLFVGITFLFLIVPNANILPERLIILVFIFLCLWLAIQKYPRWLHIIALLIIVAIQGVFSYRYVKAMKDTSNHIELMKEVSLHIEAGSLLLPFNYAYNNNWLHMHSPGYFGSGKPIAVIENYEGQLKWFPVSWNTEGPYELAPISVWAADNKKMIGHYYTTVEHPDVFSLPQKDGKRKDIPYVVMLGRVADANDPDYLQIKPILDKSYRLIFENDLCQLYRLK